MPTIFDNIERSLLPTLENMLRVSDRGDFCVGYFNLRGWKCIDNLVERWPGGEGGQARVLVGMQQPPDLELRKALSLARHEDGDELMDQATAIRLRRQMAEEFRQQLTVGAPTNADEAGLRRLGAQLKSKKVVVKLFLEYQLHAKLYLLFRQDPATPRYGILGSSNLTFAGLKHQGELNVDVVDQDACKKLEQWFNQRWNNRLCLDISEELAQLIDESWAREALVPPYHVYVKMAYHLSQEAREGLARFGIPAVFGNQLFDFQEKAVKMAASYARKRKGVLIGDVVGLGKTLMASAVARTFEDEELLETLIICPKNLEPMWDDYRQRYGLRASIVPLSQVETKLPELRRHRVVLLDESHNLRNREGKRYRVIQDYISRNAERTILLSATPYNKTYLDLSAQLRLFLPDDETLGARPEQAIAAAGGEPQFSARHQCPTRSLAAFEKSEHPDDWRELMRLYMVRRTRSFILDHYAETDEYGRKYLAYADGGRAYFPRRVPKTVKFTIDETNPDDQYARLYAPSVVDTINALKLPRYGLGNYVRNSFVTPPTPAEKEQLENLSMAGQRLMGFCRTNLFKRLESSGLAFIQSVERHVLRNYVYLHAVENGLPVPIGTQVGELLDTRVVDEDADSSRVPPTLFDGADEDAAADDGEETPQPPAGAAFLRTEDQYRQRAAKVYAEYAGPYRRRFKWLRPDLFQATLAKDLQADADALLGVLSSVGGWDAQRDEKLKALQKLLTRTHPNQKVLLFTQFADTVRYLAEQLPARGVQTSMGVTGQSPNPTELAWRFSPVSNGKRKVVSAERELRVLLATDVLSEGQNLQDAAIIVNYDLPWAIIRLIQRAGRVDRIGQQSSEIRCYSFLPADGVDRIINLRGRVRARLRQNAEVVGTDEAFFEDDDATPVLKDLYNEKAGLLDGEDEGEVDLASYAYQIWKDATDADPSLKARIESLPSVVYATRGHTPVPGAPEGALVYVRDAEGKDSLARVDARCRVVSTSHLAILNAAKCEPETPARPRHELHHEWVQHAAAHVAQEQQRIGGELGRTTSARYRTYERLKRYQGGVRGTIFDTPEVGRAIDEVYRFPLQPSARDLLNKLLRTNPDDTLLVQRVLELREADRLCNVEADPDEQEREPTIVCSMGLVAAGQGGRA